MGLFDFFGDSSSDKSVAETAKDVAAAAITTVSLAVGVHGTAVDPQTTLSDVGGHYVSSQQESKTSQDMQAAVNDRGNETTWTSQRS